MSHNPYTPPSSSVADISEADAIPRPRSVVIAVALFVTDLVLGVAMFCYLVLGNEAIRNLPGVVAMSMIFLVLGCAISALLIWKIWQGKNWARIVWVIFSVLTLLSMLLPNDNAVMPDTPWFDAATRLIDLVALFLVFGPGRAWFQRRN